MQDMSAEQFFLGFRRLFFDNGSQFNLSGNVSEQIWKETTADLNVQTYISNEGIQWQYIVELAPWILRTFSWHIGEEFEKNHLKTSSHHRTIKDSYTNI